MILKRLSGLSVLFQSSILLLLLGLAEGATAGSCDEVRELQGSAVNSVHCGHTPSAYVDKHDRVWVTFVQDEHVYVSHSDDFGGHYATPVRANAVAENIEHHGEGRPKLVVSDAGDLLLSWTRQTSANYTGDIRFTRSTDGGLSFETPRTINDDGLFTGHRFDELFLSESGTLYLAWIDKRDMEASLARDEPYPGAAIYYVVSEDLGTTFSANHPVSANSCECCRIAMAPDGTDNVAIMWRQIYDEHIRDHAFGVLTPDGTAIDQNRATVDNWYIDACPHHGPAMISTDPGIYHMSWFSGGTLQNGIHYGRYDAETGSASDIVQVDGNPGAGHPYLAAHADVIYLVWKAFTGTATELKLMTSRDEGNSWSEPATLFSTSFASDHPMLVTSSRGVYLSWSTEEYGYLLQEINDAH